jgi:hypothetical protein
MNEGKIEESIDATKQMVRGNVVFEPELVEQTLVMPLPSQHSRVSRHLAIAIESRPEPSGKPTFSAESTPFLAGSFPSHRCCDGRRGHGG